MAFARTIATRRHERKPRGGGSWSR